MDLIACNIIIYILAYWVMVCFKFFSLRHGSNDEFYSFVLILFPNILYNFSCNHGICWKVVFVPVVVFSFDLFILHFSGVCRLGVRLGWLMYFIIYPNEVILGRCANICSVGCGNWRCCIDTHLTFPVVSCTSKALWDIHLQILKPGLYSVSN